MKKGFILLEVLLATALAGYASILIFNSFNQVARATRAGEAVIDSATRFMVASHQLTRDISGAWEPERARKARLKKKEEPKPENPPQQPLAQQGLGDQEVQESQQKKKILSHVFYGTTRDGRLDTLTFITHNPLPLYWSKKSGKAVPHLVRVVYRLVPEVIKGQKKLSYTLMRQQDATLDFGAYATGGDIRSYEVIGGIKDIKITYIAEIIKREETAQEKGKSRTVTKEYPTYTDWDIEGQSEQQRGPIPYALRIELTLWDADKKHERKMTFPVMIAPDYSVDQYEPKQEKA